MMTPMRTAMAVRLACPFSRWGVMGTESYERGREPVNESPGPAIRLDRSDRSLYSRSMELPDLKDDAYLKLVRPLVEASVAFARADSRHIKSLKLTPSQFDVIATLGDTDGMTCSEL